MRKAWLPFRVFPLPRRAVGALFLGPLFGLLLALGVLALGALAPGIARADDDGVFVDHDAARAAALAGEIVPLEAILAEVRKSFPGELLEVELEKRSSGWIYEVKILSPEGVVQELDYDARTKLLLRQRSGEADRR